MRIVPAGLLAALLLLPACGGGDDDDGSGGPAEGDGGSGSDDEGAADDGTAGDDGGPSAETMCDGEIDIVSSDPITLASSSSLAVTDGGAVFVAFSGPAQTTGGATTSAVFVTPLGPDGWGDPELVPGDADLGHTSPMLAAEGDVLHLFWSMTRPDGRGNDIMYASRSGEGQWSEPLDLTGDENQDSRVSTSVRDAAVSSTGQVVVAFGSADPDAPELESIHVLVVEDGAAATTPLEVPGGDFGCDRASVTFDDSDFVHVAASCYDEDSTSAFISYSVSDGIDWLAEARLSETLFSLNTSPSLAPLPDDFVSVVWESRRACQTGECAHVMYGTNAAGGFPSKLDLSADTVRDPGDMSPSVSVDREGRVDLAFVRAVGSAPGEILIVHTEPVTEPAVAPAFEGPCRLPTEVGDEALAPTTAIDPASGDLHVLFRIDGADGGTRLAHARVPAWP